MSIAQTVTSIILFRMIDIQFTNFDFRFIANILEFTDFSLKSKFKNLRSIQFVPRLNN